MTEKVPRTELDRCFLPTVARRAGTRSPMERGENVTPRRRPASSRPQPRTPYGAPNSPSILNISDVPDVPSASKARLEASRLYVAGDVSLLQSQRIAIVGARGASSEGLRRAARLAKELAAQSVVVVSGLAKGIDTAAHTAAIEAGGRTIAVIGTPLDRAYPAENGGLQERIWREHLLVSQYEPGRRVFPSMFPERNRLMAALSHATVIIEASDTSGSLHQAAECARMGHPLFIARAVANDPALTWPARFLHTHSGAPAAHVLESTEQLLDMLR